MADSPSAPRFSRYAEATVPTEYGALRMVVYREEGSDFEHVALISGEVRGLSGALCRVHSECMTGEVFHSLKCECREQLDLALRRITDQGPGLVLYLRQEGRGIGLGNKIRAYAKQSEGYDTVDANRVLGFEDDLRDYDVASFMLNDLGVPSITLMTNNPSKVDGLREHGVNVDRRVEHIVEAHDDNRGYLVAKQERMGHIIPMAAVADAGE